MQFHDSGFRAGDPGISAAAERPKAPEGTCDVLIVGCGPAGLTLAAQLARFAQIRTRIVEQKPGPIQLGQADGIACRSMEMFNAFGFAERVRREACWVNETVFWKPDPANPAHIARADRIQDVEDGLSEFPHVILNQARVHDMYLEAMRNAPTRLVPEYGRRVTGLSVAPTGDYPVTVTLAPAEDGPPGAEETLKARYVVGCDGARSTVRQAIGRRLQGDSANQAWGVMDVLAVTDFPDIRYKCTVHSAREGNAVIIPREGGYLVRLYIELDELAEHERVQSRDIGVQDIIAAAQRIFRPYTLEVKEVAWWSVYEIGQRLTDRFDDAGEDAEGLPHVFIAGDACHTHSPKAGQGMNVSMADAFNLGWKLAAVLTGRSAPDLLRSYSAERQAIARELIEFDRELARLFSTQPKTGGSGGGGVDHAVFQDYFTRHGRFTAGTATQYAPSRLTGAAAHQGLAAGIVVGTRFHSAPVIRLADARPVHLGHCVEADGRWRLFAFAGADDTGQPGQPVAALCDFLTDDARSPLRRHTRADEDIDAVIDLRAVFQAGHRMLEHPALPPLLRPRKGPLGLCDYEKVFCPDMKSGNDIFDMRGIDRRRGALVVVRPDQFVGHVLPLDGFGALSDYFAGIMLQQDKPSRP